MVPEQLPLVFWGRQSSPGPNWAVTGRLWAPLRRPWWLRFWPISGILTVKLCQGLGPSGRRGGASGQ